MSAAGRAVGAATRFFAQALTNVPPILGGGGTATTTSDAAPSFATVKPKPISPSFRDRTNEFLAFRNAAEKAAIYASSFYEQMPEGTTTTSAPSTTTSSNWFSWLIGPKSEPSAPAPIDPVSAISCASCGARFGPTVPRRTCQLCKRTFCSRCAQQAMSEKKPGECIVCCHDCRPRLSPQMRNAMFQQSVEDATRSRFALFTAGIQQQFSRASAELAKLQYLTESMSEGTADVLQSDAVTLARVASAVVTQKLRPTQPGQKSGGRRSTDDIGNTYEATVQQHQITTDAIGRFNKMTMILRDPKAASEFTKSEKIVAEKMLLRMVNEASTWGAMLKAYTNRTIEVSTATIVFIVVFRCKLEAEDNPRFSSLFARDIADLERTVYMELMSAGQSCSAISWEKHRDAAKDAVYKWDSLCPSIISDEPSSLLPESQRSSAVCFMPSSKCGIVSLSFFVCLFVMFSHIHRIALVLREE